MRRSLFFRSRLTDRPLPVRQIAVFSRNRPLPVCPLGAGMEYQCDRQKRKNVLRMHQKSEQSILPDLVLAARELLPLGLGGHWPFTWYSSKWVSMRWRRRWGRSPMRCTDHLMEKRDRSGRFNVQISNFKNAVSSVARTIAPGFTPKVR